MGSMADILARGLPVPDIAGDYYKLQSLARQKELGQLQIQNEQRQGQLSDLALGEKREAIVSDRQLKDLYRQNPNPTDADIVSTIGPKLAVPLIKARREAATAQLTQQIQQGTLNLHNANRKAVVAGTIKDQPSFEAGVKTLAQEGVITPEEAQRELSIGYTPEMQQQMQWYIGQGYADEAAAHDAAIKDAVEKRNALLFGPDLKKRRNEAVTTAPNAAGLTPAQQATVDQQKATLDQQKAESIRKSMPNTITELAFWLRDPKRTASEVVQGQAAMKDLQQQALASRPPPADQGATLMVPNGQGGYTVTRVTPGQTVGPGAVTATQMGSQNAPTQQMRNVAAQAQTVHEQMPNVLADIDRMKDRIGKVSGRWNEFMQGKIGMDDPDFAALRADLLMMSSAVALMHARGRLPEGLRKEFETAINAPQQSADNLKAILSTVDRWTTANLHTMSGGKPTGGDTLPGGITLGDIDAEIARRKAKK